MKNLRVKPETIKIDGLAEKVRMHFGKKYDVTDNHRNEITIAKSDTIGCKLVLTKKRLLINGTFATPGKMIIALVVLILGLIIIPMAIYMVVYKPKFEAMEEEVYAYIKMEFPDSLIS